MKLGVLCLLIGFFVLRGSLEDLVVNFFPGDSEIFFGVLLIGFGLYRIHKSNYDFRRLFVLEK